MPKNAWLMTMGFFLAAALIWAIPVFGQSKEGSLRKSNIQSSETGSVGSSSNYGTIMKPKTSLDIRHDSGTQGKNKAPAKSSITLTPANPDTQPKSQTPGDTKTPAKSNGITLTPANPDTQPKSQTPGGTRVY